MPDPSPSRRLAAILCADVAGFSRMVQTDEAGTLAAMRERRLRLVEPCIAAGAGRVVKHMGDGFLAEFPSAVNAVNAALDLQARMTTANADLPDNRRIALRIGINLGDILGEGDDILGDGVNIAARLEPLAEPGGIVVSAKVRDEVQGKTAATFLDMGEQALKNMAVPVRAFRIATGLATSAPKPEADARLSVAVLPFTSLGADPDQQYFGDGITEDIITELSRFRSLFVIARHSSFAYRGRQVNLVEVGRELGVDFIVEGSLRRIGDRIRITAQLINAKTGGHVWAERYDRPHAEIFDMQDDVVASIAAATEGRAASAVAGRGQAHRTHNVAAYESVLRARHALGNYATETAEPWLRQALESDPAYAQAHAWLAWIGMVRFFEDLLPSTIDGAVQLGLRSVELDPEDSQCRAILALTHVFLRRFDLAETQSKRAIEINPADSLAVNARAQFLARAGRATEALDLLDAALRRDPFPPTWYWGNRATALFALGRHTEALDAINRKSRTFWWERYMRALCHAGLAEPELAALATEELLRLRPDASVSRIMVTEPFLRPDDIRRMAEGLRRAGLPEG